MIEEQLKKLNEKQLEAVEAIYWSIMVVAWPGTGKTQIIWLRTANIILKTWINPENILITTFTEAWVIAIKKRLVKFLWQDWYKVKVSTFHWFCSEVISDFPEKFLKERAKQTIDDIESFEILSDILDKLIQNEEIKELFSTMDRYAYLRDIKDRIGKLKTEWISTEIFFKIIKKQQEDYNKNLIELENNKRIRDLEKRRQKDKDIYDKHINKLTELNLIYKTYDKKIREKWLYDFADMINFVTEKFKSDDEILAYYAEKFQFIMIDEFQDTNNSQNNVIDLILNYHPEEQNIMVVWDDDQSIYRFQGANIENMLNFVGKYSNTKTIVLDNNYRSSQHILDFSQNLIQNNTQRISNKIETVNKKLIAAWENKDLEETNFYIFENDLKEKLFIYNEIQKNNTPDNTFAIIVKKNKQVEEWTSFLKQKWLNVNSKNSSNILNNKYCIFLLNFLNLIDNPYFNDEIFLNLIRSDLIDIENIDTIFLSRNLYQKNYSKQKFKLWLWDIIKNIEHDIQQDRGNYKSMELKNIDKIIKFRELVLSFSSNLWNSWITFLISNILKKINIFEYIEQNWNFDDLQDIFTLVNKIKSYIENNKDINLSNIINKFNLYKKFNVAILRDKIETNKSNIDILTAHGSKWLEYDFVFIPWVYEWNWNQRRSPDKLKLPIWIIWNWLQYSDLDEKEYKNLEKEIALEEERRLFFVSITRAKKSLVFTIPKSKENKVLLQSSFIVETDIEWKEIDLEINEEEKKDILISSILDFSLIKINDDEINYIQNFLENYKLSPTDLNKFIEDPKRFLREVIFRYPFLSNENLVFWSVYHKILEFAFIKKSSTIMQLEEMKTMFLDEIKRYDLTSEEYNRLKERWINWLEWYYEIYKQNNREVVNTEYNFRSKNIMFDWIPLTWKIDKIDIIPYSNTLSKDEELTTWWQAPLFTESVALIDYKTWKVKSMWQIKWIDRDWNKKPWKWNYLRQLLFYKLMFENNSELNSKFNIWELALDFVEGKNNEYKYLTVEHTIDEYEDFKNELKEARTKINNIEFWKDILT